jgi:uncharacterized protein (TIRG00374 family)
MKSHLKTIVLLAITILLLVLFLRQARIADVWNEIRAGNAALIVLSIGVTMATYALRAYRWQFLVGALGPTHFEVAFRTTVIGFAANFLLPGRVGEVVRPYLLAREENLSATSTFATIILERLFDLATVLVFFSVFLLVFDPAHSAVDPGVFRDIRMGGLTAGIFAVVAFGLVFALAGHPDAAARVALGIERVLPARVAHAFSRIVRMFVTGLSAIRRPGQLAMAIAWSFPLWLSIATGIFLVTRAFHIPVPFTGAFVVMTVLVVGVAVPTPGSVGGFHLFYQIGVTAFYAAPRDRAMGAAIVLHAVSFLPVTLLGIIFMTREGLSLGRMRGLAKLAGAQEQEGSR